MEDIFFREVLKYDSSKFTAEQTDKSERYLFTLLNYYKDFKIKVNHALLFDNLYYTDITSN